MNARGQGARQPPDLVAALILSAFALLFCLSPAGARTPEEVRTAFHRWASESLHSVRDTGSGSGSKNLSPIERMIGDARIVGLGEGIHGAAEPLSFRNRLFAHLVERLGFRAIAIESGVVESRVLNDYVMQGTGGLHVVLEQGFSVGHHTFRQNAELLRWMREYNARLPAGAAKLEIYGLDVPGSPGIRDAARGPDTGWRTVLGYLREVDPEAAATLLSRVQPFLPLLENTNGYGGLDESKRDALTATVADLIALLERRQFDYVARSSQRDFDWAERSAIGVRQTDAWFRHMPVGWKFEDGYAWTRNATQVRDRAMADNLDWLRQRLGVRARILVFTASGHMASTAVQLPDHPFREMIPMGAYLRHRYGADFVNVLNLVAGGEIRYCSSNPQRVLPLKPPPESSVEWLFSSVESTSYLLDLRRAPANVSAWLHQSRDHWNGFNTQQFATARAFDLVYYVSPVTSACRAPDQPAP